MSTRSLTYFAHFEGDWDDFERLLGAPAELRIECTCGAVLELRGQKAIESDLAIDWTQLHTGEDHKQRRAPARGQA